MPDESPMNDPQTIWQNQPTEPLNMSSDEIRRKAQDLQKKGRLSTILWVVLGALLAISFGRAAVMTDHLVPRIGWTILSLWNLYGIYHACRWIWPGALDSGATASTSLEYYRRELRRALDYEKNIWIRAGLTFCFLGSFLVVLPGLIAAARSPKVLLNAAPFFLLLSIWIVLFLAGRKRKREKLQRELEELKLLEK